MTWDDHEVVNDYANDRDPKFTDPQVFLRRRAAAYQAYFEHMPVRVEPDAANLANMRIHDRMAWGQLADIWTLDNRQYRSYHACPDPLQGGGRVVMGCNELADEQRSMLGIDQERWLKQGLQLAADHTRRGAVGLQDHGQSGAAGQRVQHAGAVCGAARRGRGGQGMTRKCATSVSARDQPVSSCSQRLKLGA